MNKLNGPLIDHFSNIEGPRLDRKKLHNLIDIFVIVISAVICGAESWGNIEIFANSKLDWLKTFLQLPNGIPSHDTMSRVFSLLKFIPRGLPRAQ